MLEIFPKNKSIFNFELLNKIYLIKLIFLDIIDIIKIKFKVYE